ncbi:MAG TPA: mannonate dehydratase [Verrucomicrobiales bacterium]|nr:mannonate dehydratase [Verrucomicrobiales bacterium]
MKIALYLTPLSPHHLRLAAQIGTEEIVAPYPGPNPRDLLRLCDEIDSYGMRLSVIERHIPHDLLVHRRPGWERQLQAIVDLVQAMGEARVPVLCYNWMPDDDWQRTSVDSRERGGALVTEFDLSQVEDPPAPPDATPAAALWENLEAFLRQIIPVAEQSGVSLALHPDDPPLDRLRGQDRIITSIAACERAVQLVPSPANGICYCQGTFASAGENVVEGISRLGPHIRFGHFRDVVGTAARFRETFQDNGQTDMPAAIRAWREIRFDGPLRPDHVPTLDGETNEHPGYEMLGRLWAVGYLRGLLDATASTHSPA